MKGFLSTVEIHRYNRNIFEKGVLFFPLSSEYMHMVNFFPFQTLHRIYLKNVSPLYPNVPVFLPRSNLSPAVLVFIKRFKGKGVTWSGLFFRKTTQTNGFQENS